MQIRTIFRLLRHPLTAGEPTANLLALPPTTNLLALPPTTKLLALLEQVPGVQTQFGRDLWKAVEWAEAEQKAGRLKDLDLDAPLKIR